MIDLSERLAQARIVPVLTIGDLDHAVPLARVLVAAGLPVLEVTLRTGDALAAIARIAAEVEGAIVGAGTVIEPAQIETVGKAGARFIVSPGFAEELAVAAGDHGMPLLPGVATPSDIMRGLQHGISLFKFFPAESLGGAAALKALAGPFPQVRFCPTGGVTAKNLFSYLTLPNVIAVGGSWMVAADLATQGAFDRVRAAAQEAVMHARQ